MSNIKLFESKLIRSIWSEEYKKWYFSMDNSNIVHIHRRKLREDRL
jgi:hypothetical protein